MFITDNDYRVVIGENALKVVSQASQEIRDNAELEACEEISGYLLRNTTRRRCSLQKAKAATAW